VSATPFEFAKGTVIGAWRIARKLGRGGQGAVWEVKPTKTKHSPPRALKACFGTDDKARARFERETQLLKECKCEAILPVVDADMRWIAHVSGGPEFAYYVAECCLGSLEDRKDTIGEPNDRLRLFHEACRAVSHIHSLPEPILHRDIKPANFLLASEPRRLVLADFGIARE
jgi:eukaryotic-like serine/threonine-protein kinase